MILPVDIRSGQYCHNGLRCDQSLSESLLPVYGLDTVGVEIVGKQGDGPQGISVIQEARGVRLQVPRVIASNRA